MSDRRLGGFHLSPRQHRLVRIAGVLAGFVGLVLLFVGIGTAVDLLVAQSHPVGVGQALGVRIEYTVLGLLVACVGFGVARHARR